VGQSRTNWHLGDLGLPDDADPMAEISELQSAGRDIDLNTADKEAVWAEFVHLMDRESRYVTYSTGVEACELKWSDGHVLSGGTELSCGLCPHAIENWRENPQGLMCKLGRQQEDALGEFRAIEQLEAEATLGALGLDPAWVAHVERTAAECDELADALLVAA
jgi:hypothetical protein